MLTSVVIRDFKSYVFARLPLAPLTVLIGANASGKSNAIEALQLLSSIGQGARLNAVRYAAYEGKSSIRGTIEALGHNGEKSFSLGCSVNRSDWSQLEMTIGMGEDGDLHLRSEDIRGTESSAPLYEVVSASPSGNDLRVAYNNFARGGRKPQIVCSDQTAVLSQLQSAARFDVGHKSAQQRIPEVCEYFADALTRVLFLDPQPSAMRGYGFKTETELSGDGRNISGVLWNICQEPEGKDSVLDLIKSLPEQNISDVDFISTPRGEAMVELTETFGGKSHKTDATLLSDGTLRVLSIAAALLTTPAGGLLVIEEVDNGVHPSRAEALLASMSELAERRNLRVLLSSHNPAMLDALPIKAIKDVVFCYRDPEQGSSKLVRLSNLPNLPALLAQGTIGHLLTTGLLDRFVKSDQSDSARARRAQRWFVKAREVTIQ